VSVPFAQEAINSVYKYSKSQPTHL